VARDTREHYTIDIVLGWPYAYTVFRLISHLSTHAAAPTNLPGAEAKSALDAETTSASTRRYWSLRRVIFRR
jgi:hypothetical protein